MNYGYYYLYGYSYGNLLHGHQQKVVSATPRHRANLSLAKLFNMIEVISYAGQFRIFVISATQLQRA